MTKNSGTGSSEQGGTGVGPAERPTAPASTPQSLPFSPADPPIASDTLTKGMLGSEPLGGRRG